MREAGSRTLSFLMPSAGRIVQLKSRGAGVIAGDHAANTFV
jgi:hypothetical protein